MLSTDSGKSEYLDIPTYMRRRKEDIDKKPSRTNRSSEIKIVNRKVKVLSLNDDDYLDIPKYLRSQI